MAARTLIIEKPSEELKARLVKAADLKKQIKLYIKKNGSAKGMNFPGVAFAKPL